jgi:putative endonuclease
MCYVYVLQSLKDLKFYFGMTNDLPKRLKKHQAGGVPSTKHRRPLELVYYETSKTRLEARQREEFLKSGPGHMFLSSVLKEKR